MDNYPDRERAFAEGQIRHEDNLINHRMGWLMTSNGFLFSAFGVVVNAFFQTQQDHSAKMLFLGAFLIIIPLVAIAVSWIIWELVRSATKQVDEVSGWWKGLFQSGGRYESIIEKDKAYPQLVGDPVYGFTGRLNIYAILPAILALAWGLLLCIAFITLVNKAIAMTSWISWSYFLHVGLTILLVIAIGTIYKSS
jgi:uncharacterized membrane protein YidH (DUF202 family)